MDSSSVPATRAEIPLGKGIGRYSGWLDQEKSNGIAGDQEGGPDGGGGRGVVPCGRGAW